MIIENLEFSPLFTQINFDVTPGHPQVSSRAVEGQILDFVSVLKLESLEVLQLPQVPQLHTGGVSRGCQVVTILRESQRRNGSSMSRKLGYVQLLFQIPNFYLSLRGSCSKNQAVRVELSACERCRLTVILHPGHQPPCPDVTESPVHVGACTEHIVSSSVQTEACHRTRVNPQHLTGCGLGDTPDPDGRIVTGSDDGVLLVGGWVVDSSDNLFGVATQNSNHLFLFLVKYNSILISPSCKNLIGVSLTDIQTENARHRCTVNARVTCHSGELLDLFLSGQALGHSLAPLLPLLSQYVRLLLECLHYLWSHAHGVLTQGSSSSTWGSGWSRGLVTWSCRCSVTWSHNWCSGSLRFQSG